MITRVVKMSFKEEKVMDFLEHFESVKDKVRNQPGCMEVILLQDKNQSNVFFTLSKWEHESDLEHYRISEFFKEVWFFTKALFNEKAEAWTLESLKV